ncbi:GyrI-like domain-containing protein [Legionella maioricensis]|uniref:GyrI-like domain-containing protein n=1 Tax=Legionella maioricensis TaxID=2896528 RepID=A0A9X2D1F6_9GAMM|nr:GyrI-like domain-containing protein [Legionella maioricensis]MCL9684759.1 GyrI-like domain-containing protein [Legionella maioricensis]MCL9687839.1 GyrI-like domain-containing protein [Legionella maioricensis]
MIYPEPKLIEIDSFTVAGLSVRTINKDEFNPQTAKLPQLWNDFFSTGLAEKIPNRIPQTPVFGVYSNYALDAADFYTVTAGVRVSSEVTDLKLNTITIQTGHYLVFKDKGPMPQVIIKTWERIWTYFESNHQHQRCFGTDFEVYPGSDEIAIHIGIIN